jgi:hypothetical protein
MSYYEEAIKKKKAKYWHDYGEGRFGMISPQWGCCNLVSHA